MKRISILLALTILCAGIPLAHPQTNNGRHFIFGYTTVIDNLPVDASEVKIWIPYPLQTPYQEVIELDKNEALLPSVTSEKKYGNKMLFYLIKGPKASQFTIRQLYKVTRLEHSKLDSAGPQDEPRNYLKQNRFVFLTPEINSTVSKLTKGKHGDLEKIRAIYDYVFENVSYDKSEPGWGQGDLRRVCLIKKGNCTDFHSLFSALAMAAKIPAKFIVGVSLPRQLKGTIASYHCWAEFYTPQTGWSPVDISEAWKDKTKHEYYFGRVDANRVEFTHGRDLTLEPAQKGGLNYFIYPYVEVDGKVFDSVKAEFYFEDLPEETNQKTKTGGI